MSPNRSAALPDSICSNETTETRADVRCGVVWGIMGEMWRGLREQRVWLGMRIMGEMWRGLREQRVWLGMGIMGEVWHGLREQPV